MSTGSENAVDGGGRLAPEARRALVALLRQGVLLASDRRLLYEALCRHRAAIAEHLADMYLHLLLDERDGVALVLQRSPDQRVVGDDDEEDEGVALVSRRPLTLFDTLLVLVLRRHYQERQTAGEQAVYIDVEHLQARLAPFLPLTTSTRSETRRLSGALDRMVERRLLARVRGDDARFEVTPVLRYVINAEALERLLAQYEALLEGGETGAAAERDDD